MNLLEIRQKFITLSGREDLASTVTDTHDTDAGADFYIQAASRYLDRKQETRRSVVKHTVALSAGDSELKLRFVRSIRNIWLIDADGDRGEDPLSKLDFDEMIAEYPNLQSSDQGVPAHWAPLIFHRDPSQDALGGAEDEEGIIVLPPANDTMSLEVFGLFHSVPLDKNQAENYWSVNHPEALVAAALFLLEGFHRNTEGAGDYRTFLLEILDGVDEDLAEDDFLLELEG